MKSQNSDLVVLFLSKDVGMVVFEGGNHQFGYYGDEWISYCDQSAWVIFTGEIILKNE